MKLLHMVALALVVAMSTTTAGAQGNKPPASGYPPGVAPPAMRPMESMPMHHRMAGMMVHAASPAEPGQAAFGAIQEIVAMLQADSHTDWSKVDVDALRQHLIDMDEVTMRATALKEPIENGLRIKVTGSDRTLAAVQRMVPEHARDIDGMYGWTVRTTTLPNGVELTVTASNGYYGAGQPTSDASSCHGQRRTHAYALIG
jgi:hypothetical protein